MAESSTAIEHVTRTREVDLTKAPWEQWNAEMVDLMKKTVLTRAATEAEVYFCLALADSLGLSPFAGEVFFIPTKSRDGDAGGVKPYIGREGLVKKATERDYYFEGDVVHANDKFRVARTKDGERAVTHSWSTTAQADRGDIIGAYAFLHSHKAAIKPAFFYAPIEEYLPTFDQDWKMGKSPWGNQRSAMIQKCAMIGAGRQRLNLSGVLIDAEVDRYMEQRGAAVEAGEAPDFDFGLVPESVRDRLRGAVLAAREADSDAWPAAKCEMAFTGRSPEELEAMAGQIEQEVSEGPVVDAVPVPDSAELDGLRRREARLVDDIGFASNADDEERIRAELDRVRGRIRQLGGELPGQDSLPVE